MNRSFYAVGTVETTELKATELLLNSYYLKELSSKRNSKIYPSVLAE